MSDARRRAGELPPRGPSTGRWRTWAACRGSCTALFYDPHPAAVAGAKALCAACPVRADCARHAIATGEEHGVWGGLTPDERPTPPPHTTPTPGPPPLLGDDELHDLFTGADPDRPALDQLLEHVRLPSATAYKTLARAVRLGVVERRGRRLFPVRH
jgi:WhiB family transcriptional regulator, redox-sensing transcriptional regulator